MCNINGMGFDYPWNDISNDEFLRSALSMENQIAVTWIPPLSVNMKSRMCKISSSEKWTTLMNNSFIPRYKQSRLPEDLNAEIFRLDEYCQQTNYPEKTIARHLLKIVPSIQITTAYDSDQDRRLIVDGLKRAIGIQQMVHCNQIIPELTVLECYDPDISRIFPVEFMHIK
jgi:hypothetical protein